MSKAQREKISYLIERLSTRAKPPPVEDVRPPVLARTDIKGIVYVTLIFSYILTAVFFYGIYLFIEPTLIVTGQLVASKAASQVPSNVGTFEYYAMYVYLFTRSGMGFIVLLPFFLTFLFVNEMSYLMLATLHWLIAGKRRLPLELWSSTPLVSIIIPAHNEEKVIEHTIETALESRYPNKEILIINDGSTDGTEQIVKPYSMRGLVRLINRPQGGKGLALNTGILVAKGEIIMVMDADGVVERNSIEKLLAHFQNPKTIAVAGNVKVGNRINVVTNLQSIEYIREISLRRRSFDLLNTVYVIPGAIGAFQKSAYSQIGSYELDTVTEDMDVTVQLLKTRQDVPYESMAIVHTEAPENWGSWQKQRLRWYGGTFQTLMKHLRTGHWWKHGSLSFIGIPYLFLSMFVVPILELLTVIISFSYIILGFFKPLIVLFGISLLIEIIVTSYAIFLDKEDWKKIPYSLAYTFFYKYVIAITRLRSYWWAYRGKLSWSLTRSERYGDISKKITVSK